MKILVTGCLGFIGSHFCRYMLQKYPDVSIIGVNRISNPRNFLRIADYRYNPRFSLITADIVSGDITGIASDVDVVVHFAAKLFVDHSLRDPRVFAQNNLWGTYNLLEEVRKNRNLKKYIQISTDEVYGPIASGKWNESSDYNPQNPYACTKAAADILAEGYFERYDVPVIISRTENNYGPFQHPTRAIPTFVKAVLKNRNIPVYGSGVHRRTWLYVEDHCAALDMLINRDVDYGVYHVAGDKEISNIELASKVLYYVGPLVGSSSTIQFIDDTVIRPDHPYRYALGTEKIQSLGWTPRYSLEEGLEKTFQWYIDNCESWLG